MKRSRVTLLPIFADRHMSLQYVYSPNAPSLSFFQTNQLTNLQDLLDFSFTTLRTDTAAYHSIAKN
jgi:hypothetical protein